MFLKFPSVYLPQIMKEQIIQKATDLFFTIGVRNVTMDDIAHELGISKKTIYVHFENKTKLVEAVTFSAFEDICNGIDGICNATKNPIVEIYEIKQFMMERLREEHSSPQYQLQKYYPKIYQTLKKKQFEVTHCCVKDNLNKGIKQGLYRSNIDIEFISRLYFNSLIIIKDEELFPLRFFTIKNKMEYYIEYHLRGICTLKGIKTLEKIINKNNI